MEANLTKDEIDFIVRALNFYWNDAKQNLTERKSLGDIERENYEYQLMKSKSIMMKLED